MLQQFFILSTYATHIGIMLQLNKASNACFSTQLYFTQDLILTLC